MMYMGTVEFCHPFEGFACMQQNWLIASDEESVNIFFLQPQCFYQQHQLLESRESNYLRAALHCILNLTDTSNSLSRVRAAGWDKEVLRYQHNTCGQTICKCQGAWSIGSVYTYNNFWRMESMGRTCFHSLPWDLGCFNVRNPSCISDLAIILLDLHISPSG